MNQKDANSILDNANLEPDSLANIAYEYPSLRLKVAKHPKAYKGLLEWLCKFGDEATKDVAIFRLEKLISETANRPPSIIGQNAQPQVSQTLAQVAATDQTAQINTAQPQIQVLPNGQQVIVNPTGQLAAQITANQQPVVIQSQPVINSQLANQNDHTTVMQPINRVNQTAQINTAQPQMQVLPNGQQVIVNPAQQPQIAAPVQNPIMQYQSVMQTNPALQQYSNQFNQPIGQVNPMMHQMQQPMQQAMNPMMQQPMQQAMNPMMQQQMHQMQQQQMHQPMGSMNPMMQQPNQHPSPHNNFNSDRNGSIIEGTEPIIIKPRPNEYSMVQALDPGLDLNVMADMAQNAPHLREYIAVNRSAYPELLHWLAGLDDEAVNRALAKREDGEIYLLRRRNELGAQQIA